MISKRVGLLLVLCFVAWSSVIACSKKHRATLYLPAEETSLAIDFITPVGVVSGTALTFQDVCHGTRAYLVSVGNEDSTQPWDYRFLLDTAGNLRGCATGPCSGDVHLSFAHISRAMFEGIDVDADGFSSAVGYNVVCRGIADSQLGMGGVTVSPIPTPSASTTPQPPAPSAEIDVHIPLLRIGEFNPTFTSAGPGGDSQTAASLSFSAVRTTTGGVIVVGGGASDPELTSIFAFYPWKISTFPEPAHLSSPRVGARAVAFLDSAGNPAVLFVGGYDPYSPTPSTPSVNSMDVVRVGSPVVQTFKSYGSLLLNGSMAFYLPRHLETGVLTPAVAILGGNYGSTYTDRYQFFFPAAPTDITICSPGAFPGRPATCQGGAGVAMGDGGHVNGVSARISTPAKDKILVAMGFSPPGSTLSDRSYLFDPETRTPSAQLASVGSPAFGATGAGNIDVSSASLSSNYVGFFGNPAGANDKQWGFFRVADSTVVLGQGATLAPGERVATALLDGTVLLTGEDPVTNQVVEVFRPGAVVTSGTFSFLQRFGVAGTCTDGSQQACVRTLRPRSRHTATRIEGSRAWINGAVVIIGGDNVAHGTEIFVPAYACSGETPVKPDGVTPVVGVDFCDRARARQVITDPENPVKLP